MWATCKTPKKNHYFFLKYKLILIEKLTLETSSGCSVFCRLVKITEVSAPVPVSALHAIQNGLYTYHDID
jgi:hypothetical protein